MAEQEPPSELTYNQQVENARKDVGAGNIDNLTAEIYPALGPVRLAVLQIGAIQVLIDEARTARFVVRDDPNALLGPASYLFKLTEAAIAISDSMPKNPNAGHMSANFYPSQEEIKAMEWCIQYGFTGALNTLNFPSLAAVPGEILDRIRIIAMENDQAFRKREKRKPAPSLTLDQPLQKD